MKRLLGYLLAGVLVIVVVIAAVVLGVGRESEPAGALTLTYQGPGQRVGEYAGFNVTFVNTTSSDASNPQGHALAKVGEKAWPCQGYDDPTIGTPVYTPNDTTEHPLVIGAGKTVAVTILCRMAEDATDSSQVWLR
jgi:hypothetical protein